MLLLQELRNETIEETALHAKRKPDPKCADEDDDRKKKRPEISGNNPSLVEDKLNPDEANAEADTDKDEEDGEEEDEDEDEDEEEDEDERGEHSNRKDAIDSKGKGILKEDKGKGKLKAGDGSGEDSSDGGGQSDDDSSLSDDPLAEVDLDNILPSRTRRRVAQPGAYLVNDLEDDSDDSDA
ncbi:hypothetical protein HHK36_015909 [Tetracentron sinense]|uniref:Uncharacterized protein n=1 Tax=Tetracentron sinense TaxID=13715 RepID=A0A834Z637_TETSI|nr:hypothetical protein HHK36_015909 [Tetracentron sinense]